MIRKALYKSHNCRKTSLTIRILVGDRAKRNLTRILGSASEINKDSSDYLFIIKGMMPNDVKSPLIRAWLNFL